MNASSLRIARSLLLTTSILCAGATLPPRAVTGAGARATVAAAGVRFGPRRRTPPQVAGPRRRRTAREEVTWRFTVPVGVTRREISLSSPCAAPHLFRVSSSSEKFFRFEPPADNITLAAGVPQTLTVVINTASLRMGASATREVNVTVRVECLDCAKDRTCTQVRRALIAKVIVQKEPPPGLDATTPQGREPPGPPGQDTSPPGPPDSGPARQSAQAPDAEADKLSREGPQFPDAFPLNDVKFKAFVGEGWWLDFIYTLAQPGTVTLTVVVDGFPPMVQEFRMGAGWHEELIRLSNPAGKLSVATYSVKAVTDQPPADESPPFTILSMAAGELDASAPGGRPTLQSAYPAPIRGLRLTNAAYGFTAAKRSGAVPLGIEGVTFVPRDILLPPDQPSANATYSFRTTIPFGGGARADVRLIKGGTSALVSRQAYERPLDAGETVSGQWDCTRDGLPSLGRHVLSVRAWYTAQDGGKWSLVHSKPLVVRR